MIRSWLDRLLFGRKAAGVLRDYEREYAEAVRRVERRRADVDAYCDEAVAAAFETAEAIRLMSDRTPKRMRTTGEHLAVPLPKRAR